MSGIYLPDLKRAVLCFNEGELLVIDPEDKDWKQLEPVGIVLQKLPNSYYLYNATLFLSCNSGTLTTLTFEPRQL